MKQKIINFLDPKEWITQYNRGWNEIYALRLFLSYNSSYKMIIFNNYLFWKQPNWFSENMPLCIKNEGGSIWLRKEEY